MKKVIITGAAAILFGISTSNAQGILDKIDRTTNNVDRAGDTADRTKNTGDKIMGLFRKKKGGDDTAETKTIIRISSATLAELKSINEKVENSKGVTGTKLKFNNSTSSIMVLHSGSTDDLLKTLQKAAPSVFAEKNIDGLDDGEISLKIKQ